MSANPKSDWRDRLFASIDARDTDGFLGFLTDDAVFRFGSSPELQGHDAIRAGLDAFFGSIAGLSHSVTKMLGEGTALVCEGAVTYSRHDGSEITLPFADVFEMDGDLISHYKIYMDIAPLYAE